MIVISTGCPAGIGPEISVIAAAAHNQGKAVTRCVLVGDLPTLSEAAELVGVDSSRLVPFDLERAPKRGQRSQRSAGPRLARALRSRGGAREARREARRVARGDREERVVHSEPVAGGARS